jgi:hypothetical protein
MLLLCCLPPGLEISTRLLSQLRELPGHPVLETVPGVAQLVERLHEPRHQGLLCLALLPAQQDLRDLLAAQSLLQDMPLVLALPDGAPETLLSAHCLRARYVTSVQRPDAHLLMAQVVARMLGKYRQAWEAPEGVAPAQDHLVEGRD